LEISFSVMSFCVVSVFVEGDSFRNTFVIDEKKIYGILSILQTIFLYADNRCKMLDNSKYIPSVRGIPFSMASSMIDNPL